MIFWIGFSYFLGLVTMIFLVQYTPLLSQSKVAIQKNETKVYEKSSLAPSVEKIYDATVLVQGYQAETLKSTGTGFVYKVDEKYGYILTNEHVIPEEVEEVKVTFSNDQEEIVKVLGKDEYLDLAVLQVDKKNITLIANIGSSEKMKIGDTVFVVGSPVGYSYRGSVSAGILSGKDRMVSTSVTSAAKKADWVMRVLQVDASVNPGNSGGPLLNVNGEVVGVVSLKLINDNIEGMGFAIPIEYAMSHVKTLENGEKINWPVLGIGMINVTDKAAISRNSLTVDASIKEGVVITSIQEKTGAEKAKLQVGDIITKIGNQKVKNIAYLRYELYQHQEGDTIEVTYIREKKERKVKVTLTGE